MGFSVKIKGLKETIDKLGKLGGKDLDQQMRVAMQTSIDVLTRDVVTRTPENIGKLRGSIQNEIRGSGTDMRGIVASPLVYAPPVEYGRKPGKMPPVGAIELWARRKGISGRGVAYVIARAIGRRGTKGKFMFKKGLEAAKPKIIKIWRRLPQRLEDLFDR